MNHETLNACPHCGAENEHSTRKYLFKGEPAFIYECGSLLATDGGTKTTLCAEREARQKAEAEVERLKASVQHYQDELCIERETRQKAEEQYLEMAEAAFQVPDLHAEVERLKASVQHYQDELCIEREARQKAEAEVERLRKDRYPFQSFDQFCNFLTSTNLIDELAVCDPEGWDGGAELSRIEKAFDRYLDQTNQ